MEAPESTVRKHSEVDAASCQMFKQRGGMGNVQATWGQRGSVVQICEGSSKKPSLANWQV